MRKIAAATTACLVAFAMTNVASAHSPFKKELQATYGLKSVSCYTCHSRKADVDPEKWEKADSTKEFKNAFGTHLYKAMASGNWSAKIAAAKEKSEAEKDKVEAQAVAAFKAALKKVGKQNSGSGKTYHEELTAGTLDGVKK